MSAARKESSARDSEFARADRAAKFILSKTRLRPKIALVLGSGLGAFADELSEATGIPYEKIPGFPRSTAIGHAGRLVIGEVENVAVAAMQGRVHFYEGYTAQQVAFPMRVPTASGFAPPSSPTPPAASTCNISKARSSSSAIT